MGVGIPMSRLYSLLCRFLFSVFAFCLLRYWFVMVLAVAVGSIDAARLFDEDGLFGEEGLRGRVFQLPT